MKDMLVLEKPVEYKLEPPDYDGLWKKIIGELFEQFTAFFAPDLHEEIDFSADFDALQQELNQEIMSQKGGKAIADKLFKVYLKNGKEKWFLIHVEVQDKDEEGFSDRMFRYFYRIYDRFDREIYAIALMTDVKKSKYAGPFNYSFYGTEINYRYNTYDFYGKDIEQLKQSSNPFATAVVAGIYASKSKQDVEIRYELKKSLVTSILEKYDTAAETTIDHLNSLIYFVDNLLKLPEEMKHKLREELNPYLGEEVITKMRAEKSNQPPTIAELIKDYKQEGREEGIEKGKREATINFAKMLLHENYEDSEIVKLTGLSKEEVEEQRQIMQE